MTNQKKRILLTSEFSLLNTGFSVMSYDLLSELHKTGKYEIAELASYVEDNDPRVKTLPWKVYPVVPGAEKRDEAELYRQHYNKAQFGDLRLDATVLDFKPDVVLSWRDYWHNDFVIASPYRHQFNFIWSACVDSEPPNSSWIDTYSSCDLMTSYTQWGLNVLKNYGGERLKVSNTDAMPGVNLDIFKVLDKEKIRQEYGLIKDINIVLTTMRNQPRKLIPNLIGSFMNFIDRCYKDGKKDIADKTYLYIHSGIPDVGWDIQKEILRYNAGSRVLLTYLCDACGFVFPSFIRGERCHCSKCGKLAAHTANTSRGLSREDLAKIYNLADIYVQYSVCEGLGIPIIEAKACGAPTITVDYSAPYELSNMGGNFGRVDILGFKQEGLQETGQFRGIPNDETLTKLLYKFFNQPKSEREKWSKKAEETAQKHHNHKTFAEKWMKLIDEVPTLNPDRWTKPPELISFNYDHIPWDLEPISFVRWCCRTLLPPKHYMRSLLEEKRLLKLLSYGYDPGSPMTEITKKSIVDKIREQVNEYNHYEMHRYNILVSQPNMIADPDIINCRVF